MKKTALVKIQGHEEFSVSYDGRSRGAVVVGADTETGRALSRALSAVGFCALGLGEAPKAPSCELAEYRMTDYATFGVPNDCGLVLYCHDAAADAARHSAILERLCAELAESRADAGQVSVCVFTPASACEPSGRTVRDDAPLHPHSLRELACAQAEMALRAWYCRSRTAILPVVFRHGELYGMGGGHVASCIRRAAAGKPLPMPGLGSHRRTLTHIDDFAAAVASLLTDDFTPSPVNIPGETMSVIDYMGAVADRFGQELLMSRDCFSEELPWGVGDCALSSALFKSELPSFRLKHRFRKWLAEMQEPCLAFA